jgi:hypothetical protein
MGGSPASTAKAIVAENSRILSMQPDGRRIYVGD